MPAHAVSVRRVHAALLRPHRAVVHGAEGGRDAQTERERERSRVASDKVRLCIARVSVRGHVRTETDDEAPTTGPLARDARPIEPDGRNEVPATIYASAHAALPRGERSLEVSSRYQGNAVGQVCRHAVVSIHARDRRDRRTLTEVFYRRVSPVHHDARRRGAGWRGEMARRISICAAHLPRGRTICLRKTKIHDARRSDPTTE